MSQQPEALRLVNEYRPTMPHDVLNSWAQDAKVMIARLHAENEALKAAVSDAVAEERMVCAELMEQQHTWITNVAASALIRARGTP